MRITTGDGEECPRDDGRGEAPERARVGERAGENQQQGHQVGAGRDPLGPRVERKPPVPRRAMGHVVGEHGGGRAVGGARVAGGHLMRQRALLAPHEDSACRDAARRSGRASPGALLCRRALGACPFRGGARRPARVRRSPRPSSADRSNRRRESPPPDTPPRTPARVRCRSDARRSCTSPRSGPRG